MRGSPFIRFDLSAWAASVVLKVRDVEGKKWEGEERWRRSVWRTGMRRRKRGEVRCVGAMIEGEVAVKSMMGYG